MRYEVKFRVPKDDSGLATYIAKQFNSNTAPYQFERPNDYRAQDFIFYDLESVNNFLMRITKELGDKFILESIQELNPTIA